MNVDILSTKDKAPFRCPLRARRLPNIPCANCRHDRFVLALGSGQPVLSGRSSVFSHSSITFIDGGALARVGADEKTRSTTAVCWGKKGQLWVTAARAQTRVAAHPFLSYGPFLWSFSFCFFYRFFLFPRIGQPMATPKTHHRRGPDGGSAVGRVRCAPRDVAASPEQSVVATRYSGSHARAHTRPTLSRCCGRGRPRTCARRPMPIRIRVQRPALRVGPVRRPHGTRLL